MQAGWLGVPAPPRVPYLPPPLLQVLANVAASNPEHIIVVEEAGGLTTVLGLLAARSGAHEEGFESLGVEALGFLTAMVDCAEMVALMHEAEHEGGSLGLVGRVFAEYATRAEGEALARAILAYYERCIFFDLPPERLIATGAVTHTISAMQTHPGARALQRIATDVLNCERSAGGGAPRPFTPSRAPPPSACRRPGVL